MGTRLSSLFLSEKKNRCWAFHFLKYFLFFSPLMIEYLNGLGHLSFGGEIMKKTFDARVVSFFLRAK